MSIINQPEKNNNRRKFFYYYRDYSVNPIMWARAAIRPRFRLATFDVTDTLLLFKQSVGEIYAGVVKAHGVQCDPKKINHIFRDLFKLQSKKHPNYGRHTGITTKDWWKQLVCDSLTQSHPGLFTNTKLATISEELFQLYGTEKCYKVPEGITDQLKALQSHNVILGVISNYDERLDSVLAANGLKDFFNFILCSYNEDVEKPDRRIFDLALNKVSSHGIKASESVHIGDQVELDYQAAIDAGWSAYILSHDDKEVKEPTLKDFVIKVKDISQHLLEPLQNSLEST